MIMKKILACAVALLLVSVALMGCEQQAPQGDANHPAPKEKSKKADEGG